MPDFKCKTYIEIEMTIKAKDWLSAHYICEGHTNVQVLLEVLRGEVVSLSYDDNPNWEIEDDTAWDADPPSVFEPCDDESWLDNADW